MALLAGILGMFAPDAPVRFVDNEEDFERALREQPYEALFSDRCYGRFGHGTRTGNAIIARNAAAAVLEWWAGGPRQERPPGR